MLNSILKHNVKIIAVDMNAQGNDHFTNSQTKMASTWKSYFLNVNFKPLILNFIKERKNYGHSSSLTELVHS